MNTLRTRIARLAAASALALGLGLAAGPAFAEIPAGAWSSTDSVNLSVEDGASPNQLCHASRINCIA